MENAAGALSQLSPEQRQAVMMQAQQEANQQIMQQMMEKMISNCFKKCAGTSVRVDKKKIVWNLDIILDLFE